MNENTPLKQNNPKARLIAFYLPQFHPIPENDEWWGTGFTEWVPVTKAQPLFPGHYQPRLPADLGFYDLRVPETRLAQAELAKNYGIEGFCYWHYWFAGTRLLERPFNEVLESGEPDFPFCLAWANHTWRSVWMFATSNRTLIEQTYPGKEDYKAHFFWLLKAFTDPRYITVDGKPLFYIYDPYNIPNIKEFTDHWRELAHEVGLKGLHLVGIGIPPDQSDKFGLDGNNDDNVHKIKQKMPSSGLLGDLQYRYRYRNFIQKPVIYSYGEALPYLLNGKKSVINDYPSVVPNWDNTPRALFSGMVFHESSPELFRLHLRQALDKVMYKPFEHRLIFIKSWNEWGEGNYLEPDQKYGRAYLEVIKQEICNM